MNASEDTQRKIAAFNQLSQLSRDSFLGSGVTISISTLDEERSIVAPVAINGEDLGPVIESLKAALKEGLILRRMSLQQSVRDINAILGN